MTHKTDITYAGVPLTVTYDFSPAQKETRIDPPYPATVELYKIYITGTEHDLSELLSDFVYDAIQTKVIEQHPDD
jgi:hypothetical protein